MISIIIKQQQQTTNIWMTIIVQCVCLSIFIEKRWGNSKESGGVYIRYIRYICMYAYMRILIWSMPC